VTPQVYGELLGALESPLQGVLAIEGNAQELVRMFDSAAGSDVVSLVDFKAASAAQTSEQ
jgi:hypothetical protein